MLSGELHADLVREVEPTRVRNAHEVLVIVHRVSSDLSMPAPTLRHGHDPSSLTSLCPGSGSVSSCVTSAKAGIHLDQASIPRRRPCLDSRFRGNDTPQCF